MLTGIFSPWFREITFFSVKTVMVVKYTDTDSLKLSNEFVCNGFFSLFWLCLQSKLTFLETLRSSGVMKATLLPCSRGLTLAIYYRGWVSILRWPTCNLGMRRFFQDSSRMECSSLCAISRKKRTEKLCSTLWNLRKFTLFHLWQKFRESNVFTKEVTKELISREKIGFSSFFFTFL